MRQSVPSLKELANRFCDLSILTGTTSFFQLSSLCEHLLVAVGDKPSYANALAI